MTAFILIANLVIIIGCGAENPVCTISQNKMEINHASLDDCIKGVEVLEKKIAEERYAKQSFAICMKAGPAMFDTKK